MSRLDGERRAQEQASRAWDALLAGAAPEPGVDPTLLETMRRVQALGAQPRPDTDFANRLEAQLMQSLATEPLVPMAPVRVLTTVPNGKPALPRLMPWRRTDRPRVWMSQLATAALVVLTLGASLVIFGGPLRQRGAVEHGPGILAVIEAPEASLLPGVIEDSVVLHQQLDELPPDMVWAGIERIVAEPGEAWTNGTVESWGVGPMVYTVESGSATASADGPFVLTRAGESAATEAAAGADVGLEPGDMVFFPSGVASQWQNDGVEPLTILGAGFTGLSLDLKDTPGLSYDWPIDDVSFLRPAMPAELTVRRIALVPGAGLPVELGPGLKLVTVESGTLEAVQTRAAVGSTPAALAGSMHIPMGSWRDVNNAAVFASEFRNTGTEPAVFLLMTVTPIGAEATPPAPE